MSTNSDNLILSGTDIVVTIGGVDVGHTLGGVKLRTETDYFDFKSDQFQGTIKKQLISRRAYLSFTMEEGSLANIRAAMNLNATALVSSVLSIDNSVAGEVALIFTGANSGPSQCTRTVTVAKAVSMSTGEQTYAKDVGWTCDVEFEAIANSTTGVLLTIADS